MIVLLHFNECLLFLINVESKQVRCVNNIQLTCMNVTWKTAGFWNVTPCTDVSQETAAVCRADR
jgi:hypothetical protein